MKRIVIHQGQNWDKEKAIVCGIIMVHFIVIFCNNQANIQKRNICESRKTVIRYVDFFKSFIGDSTSIKKY